MAPSARAALVLIALALAATVPAAVWQVQVVKTATAVINALAVGPQGGAVLPIVVTVITPGDGHAYVAGVPETGQGFGPSAQIALYVAARLSGAHYKNYTALLRVMSSEVQVGGPSASGYVAAALFALMNGLPLRNTTALTGIILPDGLIGPVGGVQQKVEAAARHGISTVLVPLGEAPRFGAGARVVEVGTVEEAIYYLTGVKVEPARRGEVDESAFREISRDLFYAVYEIYNETVRGDYVDRGEIARLKSRGMYYTAASLLYQGIAKYLSDVVSWSWGSYRALYSRALSTAREAESELSRIPVTVNNVDLVIASYSRVYEVYIRANSTSPQPHLMYARAITLKPWIDEARRMARGRVIDERELSEIARMYLDYAKAMHAYLETTYGAVSGELSESLSTAVQVAERLYASGHYLASIANSIDVIAMSAAALMSPASEKYLAIARDRALENMGRASQCGYTNTLPLSYLQFGDYFSGAGRRSEALTYYITASIYSTAFGDIVCREGSQVVLQEMPEPAARESAAHRGVVRAGEGSWAPLLVAVPLAALIVLLLLLKR
ncbi:MAG: peptidase S16 [Thermoproteaceae archaeon]|jgi:uncharacterized protein|nr:peptidase S16 [Thermoproteaceae archaeon]